MSQVKKLKQEPKKILIYGDFPSVPTGFATVTRNLGQALHKKGYIVDQVGINLNEGDLVKVPHLRYYRAARSNRDQDTFGRQTLLNAINGMKGTTDKFFNDYDYVFLLQDPFIVDGLGEKLRQMQAQRKQTGAKVFKTIYYIPIDGEQYDKWLINLNNFDLVIPFSQYGKQQILDTVNELIEYYDEFNSHVDNQYLLEKYNPQDFEKQKHNVIQRIIQLRTVAEKASTYTPVYHGSDTKVFKPILPKEIEEFKDKLFQENKDKFIIGCVNRNQPRKDIPRVVEIFNTYRKQNKEAFLYLHMDANDAMGLDLRALCNGFGMIEGKDYACMNTYGLDWSKVSPEMLNLIYNSLDVMLTATLGEGWGLTITEAMAAYCPVLAPKNTTIPEILGEGRGFIYELDKDYNTHTKGDFTRRRHRGNIESACFWLNEIYVNGAESECEKALEWVQQHTWSIEMNKMIKLIES